MLSTAYFLAKFRFDTAENEPAKSLQKKSPQNANFALPSLLSNFANEVGARPAPGPGPLREPLGAGRARRHRGPARALHQAAKFQQNLARF